MNEFVFSYPVKIYFGAGAAAKHLPDELAKAGNKVMLAYGGGSIKKNGIYDEVMEILKAANKDVIEFSGIMPNPTYAKVQEGAAIIKEENVDFILAVGGGSVIDCCKIISAQSQLGTDIWEYEYTDHKVPTEFLPMGAIVTVSGTGAEQNNGAVITHEEKKIKGAVWGTFAQKVWNVVPGDKTDDAIALEGIDALESFIEEIGLPTTFSEMGIADEEIMKKVADTCNITPGCARQLTRDEIFQILTECM